MSDAYERERQNNSRLDELSAKVSALRGVTIDIYDNARDQGVIDSTVRTTCPHTCAISLPYRGVLGALSTSSPLPSSLPRLSPEHPLCATH